MQFIDTLSPLANIKEDIFTSLQHFEGYRNAVEQEVYVQNDGLSDWMGEVLNREYEDDNLRIDLHLSKASINVAGKFISKRSETYIDAPIRKIDAGQEDQNVASEDQLIYEETYNRDNDLNCALQDADELKNNGAGMSSIMPMVNEYTHFPEYRVLDASRFHLFSDNVLYPDKASAYILLVGGDEFNLNLQYIPSNRSVSVTSLSSVLKNRKHTPMFYYVFTNTEFAVYDENQKIVPEKMAEMGDDWAEGINPIGYIPAMVFKKRTVKKLMPIYDYSPLEMTKNVSLGYSRLNNAVDYQSFTRIAIVNGVPQEVKNDPARTVSITPIDPNQPVSIHPINPVVDIKNALYLYKDQIQEYMGILGFKINTSMKGGEAGDAVDTQGSFSKFIDNMDSGPYAKKESEYWQKMEKQLFHLIKVLHPYFQERQDLEDPRHFSEESSLSIEFTIASPMVDRSSELVEIKLEQEVAARPKIEVYKTLYPETELAVLEQWILEAEAKEEEAKQEQMDKMEQKNRIETVKDPKDADNDEAN